MGFQKYLTEFLDFFPFFEIFFNLFCLFIATSSKKVGEKYFSSKNYYAKSYHSLYITANNMRKRQLKLNPIINCLGK